jgi:hypothetical protein
MGYEWDPREEMWDYGQDLVHEEFEERELDLLQLSELLRHARLGSGGVIPIVAVQQGKDISGDSLTALGRE